MQWLQQFKRASRCIAIEANGEYLCLAVRSADGQKLEQVDVLRADGPLSSFEGWHDVLGRYTVKNNLQKQRCHFVLPASEYQLMMIEAPDVPSEEQRAAVKWRIKDLIPTDVESVVIDVFALPADAGRGGKRMLYAVVAEKEKILALIGLAAAAQLELDCIDIEVLALRNLTLLKAPDRSSAILRLRPGTGDVSIYRDGNLYLTRNFKINYSGGLLDDLPVDALALEVQRSFDYFERQMGQIPPSVLYLCGEGVGEEKISDALKASLPVSLAFMSVGGDVGFTEALPDEGVLQLCIAALGGVLRKEAA